jgi:hypothetical protein
MVQYSVMSTYRARPGSILRAGRVPTWIDGETTPPGDGDRLALIASWGRGSTVTRSLDELVRQVTQFGYPAVVVRASDDREPLNWPHGQHPNSIVLRKPNVGYDFGSWAVGMHQYLGLLGRDRVLLLNDSLVGPFDTISPLIEDFERSDADVWGAVRTTQFTPHLQSFILGFVGGVLLDAPIRRFWTHLPIETAKAAIIERYELGLSRLLGSEAYATEAWIEPEIVVGDGDNPSSTGWAGLIQRGFPFVKRELLLSPDLVPDGHLIAQTIIERFGTDPMDWVDKTAGVGAGEQ